MELELIGPHPFEQDSLGRQRARIGTLFLDPPALVTVPPYIHASQRLAFIDNRNQQRLDRGQPPLSTDEEDTLLANSVDLIFDPDVIQIRPIPSQMGLALAADELLQLLPARPGSTRRLSKRQIVFLFVSDERVRESLRHHGESWRLCSLPKDRETRRAWILGSRVAIRRQPIYFYNRLTGTRWLTYDEFVKLESLPHPGTLADMLQEIADHALQRNWLGRPELDFFEAENRRFSAKAFAGTPFASLAEGDLRTRYAELRDAFRAAVHPSYRNDDPHNKAWSERMIATLFLDGSDTRSEQLLQGLSPEFFMQVEWLPGGRFEDGEFIVDPVFDEAEQSEADPALVRLCDPRAKGIIFNLIREYGDIDAINVGRIPESLSLERPQKHGRRGVYLVELKSRSQKEPIKRFIRLQKWGVWEHLDLGRDLLDAIEQSEEYTDYWLDRRLGCRQLGMNLPSRVIMRRLRELYRGSQSHLHGRAIYTTYFEREYLEGIATDKIPVEKLGNANYARALARVLGRAAAPSMIVGRSLEGGTRAVFDDGDEVVREGPDGLPNDIVVGDHSGAFGEYQHPLERFAPHYARPVLKRARFSPIPAEFASTYLEAFHDRFQQIRSDYAKRKRAFDSLFRHCKYDPAGSFAHRWLMVLRRLEETHPDRLTERIATQITWNTDKPANGP